MACLTPSPSGRRLSELLEEQQEPFSLDLHLLEKGCSPRLLDGYDTALCWPAAAGHDAAAVLRRLNSSKTKPAKKKPAGGGLLRLLLSKILRGRAAAPRKPAALQCSDSFKTAASAAAVAPPPCSDHDHRNAAVEEQEAPEFYCSDWDDGSDDEEQQLSPVSVLDHPFEPSSTAHHQYLSSGAKLSPSKNAVAVLRELLDAAYTPALLAQLLARTDDLLLRDTAAADEDDDDDCCYATGCRKSPKSCRDGESAAAAYWDAHRAELLRVSAMVAAEVPASRLTPAGVRPERQDVGAEVEAAVFEALVEELVVDLGRWC